VKLAEQQGSPRRIVLDGTAVYWTNHDDGRVMRATLPGAELTTVAAGQNAPSGLAVDASGVYWTNEGDGTVMRSEK